MMIAAKMPPASTLSRATKYEIERAFTHNRALDQEIRLRLLRKCKVSELSSKTHRDFARELRIPNPLPITNNNSCGKGGRRASFGSNPHTQGQGAAARHHYRQPLRHSTNLDLSAARHSVKHLANAAERAHDQVSRVCVPPSSYYMPRRGGEFGPYAERKHSRRWTSEG